MAHKATAGCCPGAWSNQTTSPLSHQSTEEPETMTQHREPVVYRQLAIPVTTFDRIKDFQRTYMARHGEQLTLVQTLTAIVREHQATEEGVRHDRTNKHPALLQAL
jgi:hypothetical protein